MDNKKGRILVVEDDNVDRMAFERFARAEKLSYDYIFAGSVKEANEVLEKEKFDAVLLDYMLGDGTAFDLFDKMGGSPFILITGTGDEEIAVKAMKSGAYDYLMKDVEGRYLKTLPLTVENAIKRKCAEEELIKYREHLEELVKDRTAELQAEIAERKKAEKALQEAHDKLENRVEERTAELRTANEKLQQEITERKHVEKQLNVSLEEKEILLKEIHHRAKNNMQIISSLLGLQSWYIKDERILEIFSELQHRIKSMALIHEKLYISEDLSRVELSDYIKSLTANLFSMYRVGMADVTLKQDIKDVYLDIKRAIPCGLIINELVLNSLKHAFPDGKKGEIVVKMYADRRKKHTLIVRDTGVGFPEGLDFRNTETLGMRLVGDLVKQLKGTIKLDIKGGSTFRITF